MIKLFKPFIAPTVPEKVTEVLLSGELTQGKVVDSFEEELRKVCGNPNICTVNSCTSALFLALKLIQMDIMEKEWGLEPCEQEKNMGLGPNFQVLCPPLNCAAGNLSVLHAGLDVKWYDIGPGFDSISYDEVTSKLTENTRVLMALSWGGAPISYTTLCDICSFYRDKYGKSLYVVEDRAHCPVGHYREHPSFFSAYSFQAIKHLTTGDGGLLVTPPEFLKKARLMRWFGLDRDNGASFRGGQNIEVIGYKMHLNDIAAAIGLANLTSPEYTYSVKKQIENIERITRAVTNPKVDIAGGTWMLTALVEDQSRLSAFLKAHNIECSQVHKRNDQLSVFSKYRASLPRMDHFENKYLVVPSGWWLLDDEIELIIDCLNEYNG